MYTNSAKYYDDYYAFKNYDAESEKLVKIIEAQHPSARTVLDVACGTGKHLERLRKYYQVEGLDLTPELIEIAATRLRDVPLHVGDMADFALGRGFDVIIALFGSIALVKTVTNLRRTLSCFAQHLNPSGMVIIEPWFTPNTFWAGTITANFVNEPTLKIAWMYTSNRCGRIAILDNHYTIGKPDGIEHFNEPHELGLFESDEYKLAFTNVGLTFEYDPIGISNRGLYIGLSKR